ncbi:TPA: DUF1351 domain-containing protein [Streptococcus suis]|uniref:DUF1351 domain-containing protein n=1 Tax=Streptococcus suis TaxID=1307 RepID=UPI0009457FEB|nr:DUF1351 domain-containing protein [Streptococcus suis]QBX30750.1 hypothetical protein Javan570_0018 [Streptococcus phage Javan570]MCH1695672.1 DUF1351 domain-containing protein [Streptococcus suis]RRN53860.1 DUF1351 domain-containing protein [Streptococcus suis]HEL1686030.1 DUF1351 domain-containing protein [Streptococcus suis]HEL1690896.1 DUF1351 domain-containing protein [Streptococcus suis]
MSEELSLFDNLESMAPVPTATVLDFDFEFTPAQITIVGKDLLEQALTGYVEKYKNYTVTAETFEDDAKVRAELNKLQKKVKSAVKEKLADYNKPIDEVKAWVDGLLEPIAEIGKSIDEGVKAFEEQERLKRAKTIEELFQEVRRKQQLAKRIEEMTAIAESKGLDPKKYADMLESGVSALAVHEELVNDSRKWQEEQDRMEQEFLAQHGAVCGNAQNRQNSDEIKRENMSEDKYTSEQKNASEDKIKLNKKVVKWQGDFRITFPDGETAKLFGGKGGLYEQHGIVVEKLGEWVKIND